MSLLLLLRRLLILLLRLHFAGWLLLQGLLVELILLPILLLVLLLLLLPGLLPRVRPGIHIARDCAGAGGRIDDEGAVVTHIHDLEG